MVNKLATLLGSTWILLFGVSSILEQKYKALQFLRSGHKKHSFFTITGSSIKQGFVSI